MIDHKAFLALAAATTLAGAVLAVPASAKDNHSKKQPKVIRILFVCVHNSGRSKMAENWFNYFAKGKNMIAASCGTEPGKSVNPTVVEAMREVGIDISDQQPRLATEEMWAAADRVYTMGCGVEESCPSRLKARIYEDWGLDDPKGKPIEQVRPIRDEIKGRVKGLIADLEREQKQKH